MISGLQFNSKLFLSLFFRMLLIQIIYIMNTFCFQLECYCECSLLRLIGSEHIMTVHIKHTIF